jgi:hypothetical protein
MRAGLIRDGLQAELWRLTRRRGGANWHLGVDDEASERTKARYKFPYGDFARVHRCGLLAAEARAGRMKYRDIEDAAIRLRDIMDEPGRHPS